MAKDDEREFRLRPQKPPARSERAAWASAYKILMHHARMITVGEHSSHLRLGCNLRTDGRPRGSLPERRPGSVTPHVRQATTDREGESADGSAFERSRRQGKVERSCSEQSRNVPVLSGRNLALRPKPERLPQSGD